VVVSAKHFTDITNGYERTTDGLWVHRGKFSAGPPGSAPYLPGDINANRGGGQGAYYFGGDNSKFLFYDGTQYTLSGGVLNATLAPGTAQGLLGQYMQGLNWSTPASASWYETPIQVGPVAMTGHRLRITWSVPVTNTIAGYVAYVGIGYDGVASWIVGAQSQPVASQLDMFSGTLYHNPVAGPHRLSVFVLGHGGGTLSISSAAYSLLSVVEERA
jgi:hypothetical protein